MSKKNIVFIGSFENETFANLVDWLKEIQQHAAEDVKIYLIGNKSEMED